ncbi:MAG: Fic family protein, partial [Acidimicrobiales bacterium]
MDLEDYPPTPFGEGRRTPGTHRYVAFFPAPLPRRLELSSSTVRLLTEAESALGRLAGVGQLIPNPHLLIQPYLLREALASTRIEGTEASMTDLYEFGASGGAPSADIEEVLNYIAAIEWGLGQLDTLPISVRLLREMHGRLLAGVRGRDRRPGELRTSQNWIGGSGSSIENARFVPPPPDALGDLLSDWERFANDEVEFPLLVQDALLHYQFETLHPFLDGNGRLGRLMIVFFLIARGRLPAPLLYLSSYLERDRERYYEALQAPRESGDIEPWIKLFLEAVQTQAADAVLRAQRILELRERYRAAASSSPSTNLTALADLIFERPILTARLVMDRLKVSRPTAISLLRQLTGLGV